MKASRREVFSQRRDAGICLSPRRVLFTLHGTPAVRCHSLAVGVQPHPNSVPTTIEPLVPIECLSSGASQPRSPTGTGSPRTNRAHQRAGLPCAGSLRWFPDLPFSQQRGPVRPHRQRPKSPLPHRSHWPCEHSVARLEYLEDYDRNDSDGSRFAIDRCLWNTSGSLAMQFGKARPRSSVG